MSEKRRYDSTVARMAGNIAAGMMSGLHENGRFFDEDYIAKTAVQVARLIVDETKRTEPAAELREAAEVRP